MLLAMFYEDENPIYVSEAVPGYPLTGYHCLKFRAVNRGVELYMHPSSSQTPGNRYLLIWGCYYQKIRSSSVSDPSKTIALYETKEL